MIAFWELATHEASLEAGPIQDQRLSSILVDGVCRCLGMFYLHSSQIMAG